MIPGPRVYPSEAFFKKGACANMLLINGDPTWDPNVLNDYEHTLAVIIKDGKIYKAPHLGSSISKFGGALSSFQGKDARPLPAR